MKKFKLLNILLVILFLFSMPIVHAHEVDVKNQAIKIDKSAGSVNSRSKILVDLEKLGLEENTKYTLSYQYVIISNEAYNNYVEEDKRQQQTIKNFLEYNNLQKIEDTQDPELIQEYNTNVKAHEDNKEGYLPTFAESNWIQTEDATAVLDETKIPDNELGIQPYVLWMRVRTDDGSYYGTQVITVDVPKKEENKDESNQENAKTGDEIMWVVLGALAISGLMIVSYKKVNA